MAENPSTPPGPGGPQGENTQNAGYQRLWEDPIEIGDTIPFDPAKHAPPLTPEQLEELLKDDED
jgi:hypothetical protein